MRFLNAFFILGICIFIYILSTLYRQNEIRITRLDKQYQNWFEEASFLDTKIRDIENIQKQQEKQVELLETIGRLSFVLQSVELDNKELVDTLRNIVEENNLLKYNLQRASDFVKQLFQENRILKKQLEEKGNGDANLGNTD